MTSTQMQCNSFIVVIIMMLHFFISHLSNFLKNFKALLYAIGKNSFSILILLGNQLAGRASSFNFQ